MRILISALSIIIFISCIIIFVKNPSSSKAAVHVVQQEVHWSGYKEKDLETKVQPAPVEIVDYITKDNLNQGVPETPHSATPEINFQSEILAALQELPAEIQKAINQKLVGIFLLTDLGGTAYAEMVFDPHGKPIAGFVAIDITAIDKTANSWATWKENTPFARSPDLNLKLKIEEAANDNRKNAIQYILLHEFGHILSIGQPDILPWGMNNNYLDSLDSYQFTKLSWNLENNLVISKFKDFEAIRKKIRYYSMSQQLAAEQVERIYRALIKTDFPTLYAATHESDDFAESFVTYVHAVKMQKPWELTIQYKNQTAFQFRLCWQETRCQDKRRALEKILNSSI